MFFAVGDYGKAREHYEKALAFQQEVGDKDGVGSSYLKLGQVYLSLGEYGKAKEYNEKALAISQKTGNRRNVGLCYTSLGQGFHALGEYGKAKEYHEKALAIHLETGAKDEVGISYAQLGVIFQVLCDYGKAKQYYETALAIHNETGHQREVCVLYCNLGQVFHSLGEYGKAKEYFEKALAISHEIGYRKAVGETNNNLGMLFYALNEYGQAKDYFEKALASHKEIGNRPEEGAIYNNLAQVFYSLGEYGKAKAYLEKALAIQKEIGHQSGVGVPYGTRGVVSTSLGEYDKAKEYLEKALAIQQKLGDRQGVGACYTSLGNVFFVLGEYDKAQEYYNKAFAIGKEIGDREGELGAQTSLSVVAAQKGNSQEALLNLLESLTKCEYIRNNLMKDNDEFKISFLEKYNFLYRIFGELGSTTGCVGEGLHALELGRARGLADLMSRQYNVENPLFNHQSREDLERFTRKEVRCFCLYISFSEEQIFLWILRENKPVEFRAIKAKDILVENETVQNLDTFLRKEILFRRLCILPKGHCEDRFLSSVNDSQLGQGLSKENSSSCFRLVELEDTEEEDQELYPSLSLYYKLIIAPVADLLAEESEIVIVPDRFLYSVPFAALLDESGVSLSDKLRIRMVPSLTTLKLIQNSPADYHSQTGTLIVGDPEVGFVIYKGLLDKKKALPFARKEAEMIGRLIGAQPLIGEHATKDAVLQMISSVSLIHIAAHGNAERGEIALTPRRPTDGHPQEEDYLLTMSDISKVQLRAKLVVLSCCHSACGQIKSEGVVGIARAFLGSGARSVLVALWALPDKSTEIFMRCFYKHLALGDSASECLHQAMKWMRNNGYPDVRDWAPFVLIGDDVSFDFAKLKVSFSET